MEREHQGCLLLIGTIVAYGSVIFVAYELDIPFLKMIGYMLPALTGSYIGSRYFSTAKQQRKNSFSRRTWGWLILGCLALAAVLAWLLEGRLW